MGGWGKYFIGQRILVEEVTFSMVSFLKAEYYISFIFISSIRPNPMPCIFKKTKMNKMVPIFKELTI